MASDPSSEPSASGLDGGVEAKPDIDVNGVDRVQVRRMLALSPPARLRWLEEIVADIVELRRLNEKHAVR